MKVHIKLLWLSSTFFLLSQSTRIYFYPTTTDGEYYVLTEDPMLTSTLQSLSNRPTVNLTSNTRGIFGTLELECNGRYLSASDLDIAAKTLCSTDEGDNDWISTFGNAEAYFCQNDGNIDYCDAGMWYWAKPIIDAQCPSDAQGNLQGGWIKDYSTEESAGRDQSGYDECGNF